VSRYWKQELGRLGYFSIFENRFLLKGTAYEDLLSVEAPAHPHIVLQNQGVAVPIARPKKRGKKGGS
jgi:hypothetical protein